MKNLFSSFNNPAAARKALNLFLGIQIIVGLFKIAEVYRHDLPFFHQIAWAGVAEGATWMAVLFNVLLVALSSRASQLLRKNSVPLIACCGYGYLLFVSLLALINYAVAYGTHHFYPQLNWAYLGILFIAGFANRSSSKRRFSEVSGTLRRGFAKRFNGYLLIALAMGVLLLPFLVMPYHFYDAAHAYAPKAFAISTAGSTDAYRLDDGSSYPPLYPIMLSLSMGDRLFQGRLLPFCMFLAFLAIFVAVLPRGRFVSRSFALAYFMATMQIWLGVANYYANVPSMVLLAAAGFLLIGTRKQTTGRTTETAIAAVLLCAATLMRPDGLIPVLSIIAGVYLIDRKWIFSRSALLGLLSIAATLSWELRPPAFRGMPGYLQTPPAGMDAQYGCGLHFHTIVNFVNAAQGLYLSHYGFGAFFYGLAIVLVAAFRIKLLRAEDALHYGLISSICFGTMVAEYLLLGLFLFMGMDYTLQVRVSFGRSTLHFYPFLLLFVIAILNAVYKTPLPAKQESPLAVPGNSL
jgi:hypothetical protein